MLPVLLEELKSASLPEKQQGRQRHEAKETREHAGWPLPGGARHSVFAPSHSASAKIPELPSAQCLSHSTQAKRGTSTGHHSRSTV